MVPVTGQSPVALPPIPDETGQPRPPRAPTIAGPWRDQHRPVSTHHDARDSARASRYLGTDGREPDNPKLEEVTARRPRPLWWAARATGGLLLAVGVPFVVVLLILGGFDDLTRNPLIAATVAASALAVLFGITMLLGRGTGLSASAHVVCHDSAEVRMYQLTAVSIRDTRSGPELRLTGPFGSTTKKLAIPLGLLEANPELWDLVYNGIRHSIAHGAEVDARTREMLRLPR